MHLSYSVFVSIGQDEDMADPQRDSDDDMPDWASRQNGTARDEKDEDVAAYKEEDDGEGM